MRNPVWKVTIFLLAAVVSTLSTAVLATTIDVTDPATPAAANGLCSLVEALDNANADASVHADCSAGNGADTINLRPSATYTLYDADNLTYGPTGLPVVTSNITINGFDATVKRASGSRVNPFRLVAVAESGKLTINDLTLTGGLTSPPPGFLQYNCGLVGAGILNFGVLEVHNSRLRENTSQAFNGGGLASSGRASIYSSEITGNRTADDGAGIAACGELVIFNSQIVANDASNGGGGVEISSGRAYIESSFIFLNSAIMGGGISNDADLSLVSSTVAYNSAGSIYGRSGVYGGGGIFNSGVLRASNSTFSGNTATNGTGGGLYNSQAKAALINTTFADNAADIGSNVRNTAASNMDLQNTLIADKAGAGLDCHSEGTISVSISSLIEDGSCASAYIGDPKLGVLTDNGGPTLTHALQSKSIAIDKGNDGICAAKPISNLDQRGHSRLADGDQDGVVHCDIGAYERAGPQLSDG